MVNLIFVKGGNWGENLFNELFQSENLRTNILESISLRPGDIVFHIKTSVGQDYEYGIVIRSANQSPYKKDTSQFNANANIPLPVVLRIFSKKIPLSHIDKLGETSEILISKNNELTVELLVNGKTIGKGFLKKENDKYKLKISELYI